MASNVRELLNVLARNAVNPVRMTNGTSMGSVRLVTTISNAALKTELGWSQSVLDRHTAELVRAGVISREQLGGKTRTSIGLIAAATFMQPRLMAEIRSEVQPWPPTFYEEMDDPLDEHEGIESGSPELTLAMHLSRLIYPTVDSGEEDGDGAEIRPEWPTFVPRFAALLEHYKFDTLANVLRWGLSDHGDGFDLRFGPAHYLDGVRIGAAIDEGKNVGPRASWRDVVLHIEGKGSAVRSPEELMEALAAYLPDMVIAHGDEQAFVAT